MRRKLIFRKLVDGYKAKFQWKEKPVSIRAMTDFPKGPIEVTGEISLKEPKKDLLPQEFMSLEIPEFETKRISTFGLEKKEEKEIFSATYPLIPDKPGPNDLIMAYVKIQWNQAKGHYEYNVVQPKILPKMKRLIEKLKEILEEKLDIDFSKLKKKEAKDYLKRETLRLLDYFGIKFSEFEKEYLNYFIERDFLGLGVIEPLMNDSNIEDVSCDGVNIPLYIFHRNPLLGSMPTNLIFTDTETLDSYLIRIAQLCGQSISVLDPILQGTLPDGSRVQGTLSTDIARRGSNFTIRKFTKEPFSPIDLLNYGTIDIKTLAFLWLTIDYGSSILISGGTATGKTVFLNVLSLFIKPDMKIVSIEDTAELKLPHEHWVPQVARTSVSTDTEKEGGQIDLFDLLKESMRQRPDYIILGEVRGEEAYVLFQQMATGHPSFATIHADTMERLIDRLTTPPINLPPSLIESLDLIIFLSKSRYKGKYARKAQAIYEVAGFDTEKHQPVTNKIFEWNAENDMIEIKNKSRVLGKILKKTGLKEKELLEELKRRMVILYWLQERGISNYLDFAKIINLYYNYPERVMDVITGEI